MSEETLLAEDYAKTSGQLGALPALLREHSRETALEAGLNR